MANTSERRILEDGWRYAIVQLTGRVDSGDVSLLPAVQLSDFTNNEPNSTLVGFRIDEIEFSIGEPLTVFLSWNAATPQQFAALAQSGEMNYRKKGGLQPDRQRSGYDGAVNLTSGGYIPGGVVGYTILLKMVKLYVF